MSPRFPKSFCPAPVFITLCVFPVTVALGEPVMLRREYTPGRISYVERRMDLEQEISGLPMPPMKFSVRQLYGLWEKVESATNDKVGIMLTYDRAARKVEAPMMGEVEFDTDDPEYEEAAPQLGTVLRPMIGMAITMEVDKDGNVLSFSGMDAINRKISEEAVASMHWEQMKEEFTDERGKETLGRDPLRIYPNKKVDVGDTWKASSSIAHPPIGTIVTDYQYRVDRIGTENGRKIVSISITGVVSSGPTVKDAADSKPDDSKEEGEKDNDTAVEDAKETDAETEVSGSVSGTALYDVELGRVVKRNSESEVDIKVPLSKLIPNMPAGEEPQMAHFKTAIKSTTLILAETERNAQKAEARKKAEMRKKAEEADDDDEDDEEEDEE